MTAFIDNTKLFAPSDAAPQQTGASDAEVKGGPRVTNPDDVPPVMFLSDDHRDKTADEFEALQNLLYLIAMDSSDPAKVKQYADYADGILKAMRLRMLPDT